VSTDGLYLGLMSGTSLDGVDAALVRLEQGSLSLLHSHSTPLPPRLTERARALAQGVDDSLDRVAMLDRDLARSFATAALDLLAETDFSSESISAIGSHGQTVRHNPSPDLNKRYSVQLGDPSTIAEITGITTIADFRRRDIAAGGEGAPLVPPFHAQQFGCEGEQRAIVNIGGIANATLLDGKTVRGGFDCGPGNTLLDAWVRAHRGSAFDAHGAWSAEHAVDENLLGALTADPYHRRRGPRSTGPEYFNLAWLKRHLNGDEKPGAVQATLCEFTAQTIVEALVTALPDPPQRVFVCGGGSRNTDLMRRLDRLLSARTIRLGTTDELGLSAEWVEACAFAWLAARTLAGLPGNEPVVTGATGARILGAIYPA